MTIILFLIDTSASMNQRTYLGTTLLDVTKGAVENFMKIRARDPASRGDRYMLLTFEDPPANIKAGWKESHGVFVHKLKNLQAMGLTSLGTSLKHAFDLLNINRMQSGIDTYGMGRCPFYMEPAVILCFTDGRKLTSSIGVQSELNLPMNNPVPGSELTREPFRWDQRLFGICLRLPATPPPDPPGTFIPPAPNAAIDVMCEVTGGRSYNITSYRMLMGCLESLVQKVQAGVVINFEKIGPDPPDINKPVENGVESSDSGKENTADKANEQNMQNLLPPKPQTLDEMRRSSTPVPTTAAWHTCRKLMYVQRSAQKGYSVGHWPIPESFWPDLNSPALPARNAHPSVKFSCTPCEPMVVENLPFDKYELEPSPLTQYILERRQPSTVWQVFVSNSAKYSDVGHPFGYLKASSNLSTVNLFVMPYNYPVLLPLLDELFKVHKLKPTQKWRQQFDNYLKTMPVYYAGPLRRALARMGAPSLVPENMENCLSYSVISYLKKLKNQAKIEYERLVASVVQEKPKNEGIKVAPRSQISILQRKDFHQLMHIFGSDISTLKEQLNEYNGFTLAVPDKDVTPQTYRNPYDIPRKQLLDQLAKMRANFLQPHPEGLRMKDSDQIHSIPVQEMGNYQEYLKRIPPPLREIDTQPVRLHMFGNPFKVNKNIMIDEADEAMPGQQVRKRHTDSPPGSPRPGKRKPGPLPKDFPVWRPGSPAPHRQIQQPISIEMKENIEEKPPDPTMEVLTDQENGNVANHVNNIGEEVNDVGVSGVSNNIDYSTSELSVRDMIPNNVMKKNHKKETQIQIHNAKIKQLLVKEVKKPGRNYDTLFEYLNTLQGNLETKKLLIADIMKEAARFKKRTLIGLIEQFQKSLIKIEAKKQRIQNANRSSPMGR